MPCNISIIEPNQPKQHRYILPDVFGMSHMLINGLDSIQEVLHIIKAIE